MFYGLECWVVSNITEKKVIIAEVIMLRPNIRQICG